MSDLVTRIIKRLKKEIAAKSTPENQHDYQRFFKEKLKEPVGLKTPILRKISDRCYKEEAKDLSAREILAAGDLLLASNERYMRFVAFEWAIKVKRDYEPKDFKRFETWLKKYVENWGACDHLCCGPLGNLIFQFPELVSKTKSWRKSNNRWVRRASAVSLILPVRKEKLLPEVFTTAETLLEDADDMVQKGYGWMLKEASHEFPNEVFAFVMDLKATMPRTALRYAIEKYPPEKRKVAMAK